LLHIYTDGACSQAGKSSGPGGWGMVVVDNGEATMTNSGGHIDTTNNIMEMTAFFQALTLIGHYLLEDLEGPFYIYSDSAYIIIV